MSDKKSPPIEDEQLMHDLLNKVGAAKMNAEMALRSKDLPGAVRKNLDRVLSNLLQLQSMITGEAATEPTSDPQASAGTSKSILLIDDSQDMRALFLAVLKPRGYVVTVAKDQQEALATLSRMASPDLVLLDYSLHNGTGSDLLNALEKAGSKIFTESKIVLFTGHGDKVKDPRAHAVEQKSMDLGSIIKLVEKYV